MDIPVGCTAARELGDGRALFVYPMAYTFRLCVGPVGEGHYDRGWCYEPRFVGDIDRAFLTWDGNGDPPGRWLKEVGTERRRHFDDSGAEVVSTHLATGAAAHE